ncbi:MAG: F0F1 ATP synthase subunit delta [Gemmatimonadaceae bacterium]|nr:F0F1 ATP synthase subunit delta [Gemmatimonadaceae bacterium]
MESTTVGRNYAEVLHALATKAGDPEGWGRLIDAVAHALGSDATMRRFLESPRIEAAKKQAALTRAFGDTMPAPFVRFLTTLVAKRRQMAIPQIASEYRAILDAAAGRVHATVTVARPLDQAGTDALAAQLSKAFAATVVPHVQVDAEIIGGVVVRVGDKVMDGSVRRRLGALRSRMLGGAR